MKKRLAVCHARVVISSLGHTEDTFYLREARREFRGARDLQSAGYRRAINAQIDRRANRAGRITPYQRTCVTDDSRCVAMLGVLLRECDWFAPRARGSAARRKRARGV